MAAAFAQQLYTYIRRSLCVKHCCRMATPGPDAAVETLSLKRENAAVGGPTDEQKRAPKRPTGGKPTGGLVATYNIRNTSTRRLTVDLQMDCSSWGEALAKQQRLIQYMMVPVELLTKAAALCRRIAAMKSLSSGKKNDLLDTADKLESY